MKKILMIAFLVVNLLCSTSLPLLAQWQPTAGPYGGMIGHICASGPYLFASTGVSGIYRSADQGATWTVSNNGLPSGPAGAIYSIAAHGPNIFAGLASGGIYRSLDYGDNWTAANSGLTNLSIWKVACIGDTVFAGTDGGGLFRSTNNGSTWSHVTLINNINNQPATVVYAVAVSGSSIFVGNADGGAGVFHSTDNGNTWTTFVNGLEQYPLLGAPFEDILALTVKDGFVLASCDYGLKISPDTIDNWTVADSLLKPYGFCVLEPYIFAKHPGQGIFKSADYGYNWEPVNFNFQNMAGVNDLYTDGSKLFVGTSYLLVSSCDTGNTWTCIREGFPILDIWAMSNIGNIILTSAQYQLFVSSDQGASWNDFGCDKHQQANTLVTYGPTMYMGSNNGVYFSTDTGANWTSLAPSGPSNYNIKRILKLGTDIFASAGGGGVILYNSMHPDGIPMNNGFPATGRHIHAMAAVGSSLYVACMVGSGVFKSDNLGQYWSAVNNGLMNGEVLSLVVNGPYIFAGTTSGIYRSLISVSSWAQLSNGIPAIEVFDFALDGTRLFAGTSEGVYLSVDFGDTWVNISQGLPNWNVHRFTVCGPYIYAGLNNDPGFFHGQVWKR